MCFIVCLCLPHLQLFDFTFAQLTANLNFPYSLYAWLSPHSLLCSFFPPLFHFLRTFCPYPAFFFRSTFHSIESYRLTAFFFCLLKKKPLNISITTRTHIRGLTIHLYYIKSLSFILTSRTPYSVASLPYAFSGLFWLLLSVSCLFCPFLASFLFLFAIFLDI